eukprot:scaffold118137_cov36-Phaeocystis_antarctica.AAC.1
MLGAGSVHLWRAWFSSWKMAFGVPKTPIFSRCAGELQRPLFITPTYTPEKLSYTCRQIHWNLVPDRKNRVAAHALLRGTLHVRLYPPYPHPCYAAPTRNREPAASAFAQNTLIGGSAVAR